MTMQLIFTSPVGEFLWRDLKWHFCMCLKTMLQRLFLHHSTNTKLVIQVWNCTKSTRKNRDFLGQIYKIWSWELAISKMLSVKKCEKQRLVLLNQSLTSIQDIFSCAFFVINMIRNLPSLVQTANWETFSINSWHQVLYFPSFFSFFKCTYRKWAWRCLNWQFPVLFVCIPTLLISLNSITFRIS